MLGIMLVEERWGGSFSNGLFFFLEFYEFSLRLAWPWFNGDDRVDLYCSPDLRTHSLLLFCFLDFFHHPSPSAMLCWYRIISCSEPRVQYNFRALAPPRRIPNNGDTYLDADELRNIITTNSPCGSVVHPCGDARFSLCLTLYVHVDDESDERRLPLILSLSLALLNR